MSLRIGIDFDNTIVRYDEVFAALARERGLVPASFSGGKTALRDALRAREGGEQDWTALQARAYGPHLREALPFEGVSAFFATCRTRGIPLVIVSHKSEFAAAEPDGMNLREAAQAWLSENGFIGGTGQTIAFFESTRAAKIARIGALGCSVFIDDLEEVFNDRAFPTDVRRLLFVPDHALHPSGNFEVVRSWQNVADLLLR